MPRLQDIFYRLAENAEGKSNFGCELHSVVFAFKYGKISVVSLVV